MCFGTWWLYGALETEAGWVGDGLMFRLHQILPVLGLLGPPRILLSRRTSRLKQVETAWTRPYKYPRTWDMTL